MYFLRGTFVFLSYSRLKLRDSGVRLKASQHIWSLLCDKVKPVSHCQSVIMLWRNNTINRNAHECFHSRETPNVDRKSHMILWRHECCLSRSRQFGRGYKENLGNVPAPVKYKVFTSLILVEPPSKVWK